MIIPSVSDFKAFFSRDFPYLSTSETVMDADITRALTEASAYVNESLFSTQALFTTAFLYMTAHCLVTNLRASSQGLSGSYSWLESSKSVGSVSQSFAIPESITTNPVYAMYCKTTYGAKYLSLVLPLLHGNMGIAEGTTQE